MPGSARAHAIVVAAQPAMNSTVLSGELEIRLDFNSRIDLKRSRLTLERPDGGEVAVARAAGAPPAVLAGLLQRVGRGAAPGIIQAVLAKSAELALFNVTNKGRLLGFLSVVLRGLDFVAQSVLLGSVTFAAFVATPLAGDVEERGLRRVFAGCRRVIRAAALATIVAVITATVLNAAVLATSLEISWREVAGAGFVIAGAGKVVLAAVIGLLGSAAAPPPRATRNALAAAGALFLCAALADTHAAARLTNNGLLLLATGAHELGAALWLGGLPCFWLALQRAGTRELATRIGKRFSALAITGVALILAGAAVFAATYIGSIDGVSVPAAGASDGS